MQARECGYPVGSLAEFRRLWFGSVSNVPPSRHQTKTREVPLTINRAHPVEPSGSYVHSFETSWSFHLTDKVSFSDLDVTNPRVRNIKLRIHVLNACVRMPAGDVVHIARSVYVDHECESMDSSAINLK